MTRRPGELYRYLHSLLHDVDPADVAGCHDRLRSVDPAHLLDCCLAADEVTLAGIAAGSYVHANGHDRISLPRLYGRPLGIQVHIWRAGGVPDRSDPDAHNHRWPFVSRVLAGELHNHLFQASPDPHGGHWRYRHTADGHAYRLARQGPAALTYRDTDVYGPADSYAMAAASVHRVTAPDRYTATLSLELAPVRDGTDVYIPATERPPAGVRAPDRFPPGALREKLRELRRHC